MYLNRAVSCYTLFKGWLPLSQPPVCQGRNTSLKHLAQTKVQNNFVLGRTHKIVGADLGTLDKDLGCFPFELGP